MMVVRHYQPDEDAQVRALLVLFRAPVEQGSPDQLSSAQARQVRSARPEKRTRRRAADRAKLTLLPAIAVGQDDRGDSQREASTNGRESA